MSVRKVPVSSLLGKLKSLMPTVLDLNAAILLSIGANQIYPPAGWITAGIASLVINWRLHSD